MSELDFTSLAEYLKTRRFTAETNSLSDESWTLIDRGSERLLKKIRAAGIPLGEYVKGGIYYGVKTGFNDAFIIDNETRKNLIGEDKMSAEIIKPFLAGRDIKRYESPKADRYMIFSRRGIEINSYPAVKRYLAQNKKRLTPKPKGHKGDWEGRKPGSYEWYELQDTVDYFEEFEKPKIMLPDISLRGNFMLDPGHKLYSLNTTYIIGSSELYLLGILNSRLVTFFYSNLSPAYNGGYLRFIYQYLVQIPIAQAGKEQKERMESLVNEMIQLKTTTGSESKQQYLDSEIDRLVYELYGLSEEEIKIVEG